MKRSTVYIAVSVALSLLVVTYVARHLNWALTYQKLLAADWRWLAAALVVFGINYVLRTIRLRALLDAPEVPLRKLLGVMMLYGMFNYLLPAKSGEVSYVLLTYRYLNTSLSEGTATLITTRLFDFGVIALVLPLVLTAFFDELPDWLFQSALLYCVIVIGAAVALLLYLRNASFGGARLERATSSLGGKLALAWHRVMQALSTIDRRGQYLPLWLLSSGIWLCVYTNFYCMVVSMGFEPTFLQMIVVSIILVPLTLLPVQGIANIGAHEAGWVLALSMFGQPMESAMIIAVTTHVILFSFVLLLGAAGAILLRGRATEDQEENATH